MKRIPLHSWEMEFSIQYHVTIYSQLNDQNSIRYKILTDEQVEETPRIEINYQVNEKCFANVGY
jgi:hypothetical protein